SGPVSPSRRDNNQHSSGTWESPSAFQGQSEPEKDDMVLIDRPSAKRSLIGAFVALQIADILSTENALARHAGVEQNALMALAQDHLGSLWWGPKLAVALACAVIMAQFPHN